jgi:hypothetical protein
MLKLFCVPALVTMLVVSCSSSSKDEAAGDTAADGAPQQGDISKYMQRGWDPKARDFDHQIRSQFDQQSFAAGKNLKTREFRTGDYTGQRSFKNATDYQAGEFSQADKRSRDAASGFRAAGTTSRDAGRTFATDTSRDADRQSRDAGRRMAGADERFATGAVRDALQSQQKNNRPKIIKSLNEGFEGRTAYSEADVKRMVNRN